MLTVITSSMPSWPWWVRGQRADRRHWPDEEVEQVDVVDRVLEQCAGTGAGDIGSPRRAVVTLDRDELVVAEHDRQWRAGGGIGDQVTSHDERR